MKSTLLSSVLACALLGSCGEDPAHRDAWTPLAIASLDAAQAAQYEKAGAARDDMFGQLMATLMREMGSAGPAGAIRVCSEVAPEIAQSISEQQDVRIGRTSWKLRNPENAAPEWAASLLADRPEEGRAALGPQDVLGVTFPIRVASPCLRCHGMPDSIADDVREALASAYPDDQATGFAEGDLRGWFWVEVPRASR